jgi:hypothetical protein
MYACGSTTGAGVAAGEAIGAETAVPPHELQPEATGDAQESQADGASQQLLFLHEKILASRPRLPNFDPQPHPLSQDGAAAQGSHAAISAPQLGPQLGAAQPEPHGAAISAPQLGPADAHGSQEAISAPQLGAQADLQASLPFMPQSLPFKPRSAERIGVRGAQQELSTPQLGAAEAHGSHEAISAPQLGPQLGAAHPDPHGAAISAPQVGPAPQPDPQGAAISAPQLGSQTDVSQQELEAPQPRPPSRRLNRSPPKLCPQRLAPRTNEPTTMLNFIEPNLPTFIVH